MKTTGENIRNIGDIPHIDYSKTTLIKEILGIPQKNQTENLNSSDDAEKIAADALE